MFFFVQWWREGQRGVHVFFFFREEKGRRKSATVLLLSRGAVFLPVKEGKRIERGDEGSRSKF